MTTLSADRPSINPKDDLFGNVPFANSLVDSISCYPGSDGLVLALYGYGPWGFGKTTVLSYVQYFRERRSESEQPILFKFILWWFSGQENLARAFLGQLQAGLHPKSEKFKQLGDLFAEGIGGLIDLTGVSGGAARLIGKLLGQAKRKPKDVPVVKGSITGILQKTGKRIRAIINDIDGLTPEETFQLFIVITALADIPNVVYLPAFDRDVAAQAIEQQNGLPSERYLEKLIQVPFELPPVNRVALYAALFKRFDEIPGDFREGSFDQSYWTNVYHDGIDALIQMPRDVVQFTNTLAVTYPAVRGELDAVNFIALKALRVFLPGLYDLIRTNPDGFSGHSLDSRYDAEERTKEAFQTGWAQVLPDQFQENSKALTERIFPRSGRMGYGSDWLAEWRRKLRVCHPGVFPIHFRLTVPPGARRSEMVALLSLATSLAALGNALV